MPFAAAIVWGALFPDTTPISLLETSTVSSPSLLVGRNRYVVFGAITSEALKQVYERGLHAAQLFQVRERHTAEDRLGFDRER